MFGSVHNDYQRHLLYLWAYPEFELNKMAAWSTFAQDPKDGHIWESLGYTGKPMDQGGGRYMGDTTSLYLLEMYEIYRHNGNKTFIESQWASAKRAVSWMIGNAQSIKSNESSFGLPQVCLPACLPACLPVCLSVCLSSFGLPQKLATTYDHFGFHTHNTVAYNGHIYLTALKAVEELAKIMDDTATAASASKAFSLGKSKLMQPTSSGGPLWDGDKQFWHCHSDTETQVFTDTL